MAKLLSTTIDGFLSSMKFVSGALGSGWRIFKRLGKWVFEIDDIVVRGTMTVFELLISKVRAIKGALGITQASGKIKSIREDEKNYYLEIEDEMSFCKNDIIRMKEFSGGQRNYWVIISGINGKELIISKSEFERSSTPQIGDEVVQFGNTTDKKRQSAIYLHADENGQPAIDILFGIHSKTFDGCTKIRIGGDIPGTDGLKGFYCENGMLKGVNESGEVMYCLYPDGTAELGAGAALFKPDKSGHIADGAISWEWDSAKQKYVCTMGDVVLQWDNLSPEAKENLKGDPGTPGKDANLLPWVEDWNSNKMQIGEDYLVSPKIFAGINAGTTDNPILTGVAFGYNVITTVTDPTDIPVTIKGIAAKDLYKTGVLPAMRYYLHIKYSNDGGVTFTNDNGDYPGNYIGYYVDTVASHIINPSKYKWEEVTENTFKRGFSFDILSLASPYFHVRFSDSPTGNPMKETPSKYVGGYVSDLPESSSDYNDYGWQEYCGLYSRPLTGIFGLDGGDMTFAIQSDGSTFFKGTSAVPFVYLSNSDAISYNEGYLLKKNLSIIDDLFPQQPIILPSNPIYNGRIVNVYNKNYPPYTKSGDWTTRVLTQNGVGIGGIQSLSINESDRQDPLEVRFAGAMLQFICCAEEGIDTKWICLNYH